MPLKVELRVCYYGYFHLVQYFPPTLNPWLSFSVFEATEAMKEANKQTHKKRKLVEV